MTGRAPSPEGETQAKSPSTKTRWGREKQKKTTNNDFEKITSEKKIHFYKYGAVFKNIHTHLFLTRKPHCLYIFFRKKKFKGVLKL
jgi:hypothetical protein